MELLTGRMLEEYANCHQLIVYVDLCPVTADEIQHPLTCHFRGSRAALLPPFASFLFAKQATTLVFSSELDCGQEWSLRLLQCFHKSLVSSSTSPHSF